MFMPGIVRRDRVTRFAVVVVTFLALACNPEPTSLEPSIRPLRDLSAAHCVDVATQVSGTVVPLAGADQSLNALTLTSTSVTIAGITGSLQTIITGTSPTGRGTPTAQHITLTEHFVADAGGFTTEDRGVCAPAGTSGKANVCQLNNALTVVSGTGAFANSAGQLTMHGTLDLDKGTLTADVRGRLCGDGLGKNALPPFAVQTSQPVSALIGPDGGVVRASLNGATYVLRIPPAALDVETTISIAPIISISPIPFSGDLVAGAHFEPNGLVFRRPAALEMTFPNAVSTASMIGVLIDDAGNLVEAVPAAGAGPTTTVITIPIRHFTHGVVLNPQLARFVATVTPILNGIPPTLPPTQVAELMSILAYWVERYGFDVCSQTALCGQIESVATQSLQLHQNQACLQVQGFLNAGAPFLARDALANVFQIAVELFAVRNKAQQLGVPGFDPTLDLSCIFAGLRGIIDAAKVEAKNHTSTPILLLFTDIAADASSLGSTDVETYAMTGLKATLGDLATAASQLCSSSPSAGEHLVDLVLSTFSRPILEGIETGLGDRFRDVLAGCRMTILPALPTVTVGNTIALTATTAGLSPGGVTWSIPGQIALQSTIDPTSGVFTAGTSAGTVTVLATSNQDANHYKRVDVTITDQCPAGPVSPSNLRRTTTSVAFASAPSCIQVVVSPANASVVSGATQQFTATVTGTANTAVTWSATGGTITQAGLFTAGSVPGTYAVTATSSEDQTANGQQPVVITPSSPLAITVLSATANAGGGLVTNPTTTLPVNLSATGPNAFGNLSVVASGNSIIMSGSAGSSFGDSFVGDVLLQFTTTKQTTFTATVNPGWVSANTGSQMGNVGADIQTTHGDATAGYSVGGGVVFDNRLSATITVAAGVTVRFRFGASAGSGASGGGVGATITISP